MLIFVNIQPTQKSTKKITPLALKIKYKHLVNIIPSIPLNIYKDTGTNGEDTGRNKIYIRKGK